MNTSLVGDTNYWVGYEICEYISEAGVILITGSALTLPTSDSVLF